MHSVSNEVLIDVLVPSLQMPKKTYKHSKTLFSKRGMKIAYKECTSTPPLLSFLVNVANWFSKDEVKVDNQFEAIWTPKSGSSLAADAAIVAAIFETSKPWIKY